jgi:hypothetical protein
LSKRERAGFRAERGLVLSMGKKIMSTLGLIVLIVVLLFVFGGGGGYYYSRRGR